MAAQVEAEIVVAAAEADVEVEVKGVTAEVVAAAVAVAAAATTSTTSTTTVTTTTTTVTTVTPTNTNNCNNLDLEPTATTKMSTPTTSKSSKAEAQSSLGATPIRTKRPKASSSPYSKPILLSSDRRSRKKKRISWNFPPVYHHFEHVADERINVYRMNADQQMQNDSNASANANATGSSLIANNKSPDAAGGKMSNASVDPLRRSNAVKIETDKCVEYSPWRPLILIDFTPELPAPGWNSIERSAQAEREAYVLGAIDLPGQPSTLDEPDQQTKSGSSLGANTSFSSEPTTKEGASTVKVIPFDNPEGMFSEYPHMYDTDIVNGIKMSTDGGQQPVVQNIASFCNQQSQLIPNQFQQQLVPTTQNPFTFQDMGGQFQQQAQLQIQFPFQQQRQSVQTFQQPIMPFANQQQQLQAQQQQLQHQQQHQLHLQQQQQPTNFVDQQSGLTGPVMPWLNYPFNQVNENSHAHLFRRPAT